MCKKTKAALQHQSNSIIRMGTAVKPVWPSEASTMYKSSSLGVNSSNYSSCANTPKGKDKFGNNHEKWVRMKEKEIVTLSSDSSMCYEE
jgi:hypothetical protein